MHDLEEIQQVIQDPRELAHYSALFTKLSVQLQELWDARSKINQFKTLIEEKKVSRIIFLIRIYENNLLGTP
jgi:uncharacterized membrane protein